MDLKPNGESNSLLIQRLVGEKGRVGLFAQFMLSPSKTICRDYYDRQVDMVDVSKDVSRTIGTNMFFS